MKIGIDARFYGPEGTGIGRTISSLLPQLERLDQSNQYTVYLKRSNFDQYLPQNPNFVKKMADIPWYSWQEQIILPRIFKRANLDLLYVPHFNVPVNYQGKLVVTVHDLTIWDFKDAKASTRRRLVYNLKYFSSKWLLGQALKKAQKITVPSNFIRGQLLTRFPLTPEKIVVNYEAADSFASKEKVNQVERNRLLSRLGVQESFLLYVGNCYPYKNIKLLIKAFALVDPRISLLVASGQNKFLNEIKKLAWEQGVDKRVIFPGFVSDGDLNTLYQSASCFVFPSLSEGFGLPGLEAMASGLPVLASDIPTFKEVYDDAALYFDPTDPTDLSARLNLILNESEIRAQYIKKGLEQVKKYRWESYALNLLGIFNKEI